MNQYSTNKKIKIAHLSSAHPDGDIRIFHKQCVSLANHLTIDGVEIEIHLILSGVTERIDQNVHIHTVPHHGGNRLKRMWTTVNQVYAKAKELNADIYHFHDPELLRIAKKLKRNGKKVIYDAHEDLPRQLLGKSYLRFKGAISSFFESYENYIAKNMDAIVTATPFIRDRFSQIHPLSIAINNFPLESEIDLVEGNLKKENKICFIGGISSIRGIKELINALDSIDVHLDLAGGISDAFKAELKAIKGWEKVNELGFIDRPKALEIKKESFAGVVTFLPLPNHINAQPNKIFEYMASGLPVIGSDFPLWREIIVDNECGLCVNPTDPIDIAKAILFLKENPVIAHQMGENGKRMVKEKYNWKIEEKKLFQLYQNLISPIS